MYIKELILKNFRNYESLNIEFSPDINFIIGDNGTGKSNILEAIFITSNLKSFRNISDSDIVKWNEDSYFCSSILGNSNLSKFDIGFVSYSDKTRKKLKIDDREIKRASEYYGKFLTVVFSPIDINIINGSPDIRRKFFDSVLSKIESSYLETLNDFKKIISSRNKLLKLIRERKVNNMSQLEVWDKMFAEKASFILKSRMDFMDSFSDIFMRSYSQIAENDICPCINYKLSTASYDEDVILKKLQERRTKDILMGSTGIGPHRDDYVLSNSDGLEFVKYASQGQRRTAAISLKISEFEIIEKKLNKKCVILVDDIFSELDEKRRNKMVHILRGGNQVIFTMVNSSSLDFDDFGEYKSFAVGHGGTVEEL